MEAHQQIPIEDCGESLITIPTTEFAFETPHPYQKLGAPYGEVSPYCLRESVLEALLQAQQQLQMHQPHWQIKIFDAYRPIAVQQFMVDYTFQTLWQQQFPQQASLSPEQHKTLMEQVHQFWAQPSENPKTPPPHSTGAAIDITLVNEKGETLEMGSAIDELSPRSYPNYYQDSTSATDQLYHQRRELLKAVMTEAGFRQHPKEWWHFSLGDQRWAWLKREELSDDTIVAYYGGVV